jgi:hypothetical protein
MVARRDPERGQQGCFTHTCVCRYSQDYRRPFPEQVPLTSIYSKGDGVVRWRACVVPYARCVEVTGSHIGLAFNRHAYREIADDARADGVTRTAAVLGAGTIGLSWAALFAAHDLDVRVQDPRPDLQDQLDATVAQLAPVLGRGLGDRITVAPTSRRRSTGVDVVQENGPERLDLKQELWARVEAAAPASALLLSSTSGLMPSDMAARMREPGRLLVGHPFNPPHVVPLVEVVPVRRRRRRGRRRRPTSTARSARCRSCCARRSAASSRTGCSPRCSARASTSSCRAS